MDSFGFLPRRGYCDYKVKRAPNELDMLGEIAQVKDVGAGLVDVKSFWVEPAEEVAERVRQVLQHVPPERLTTVPDCGFFQLPRWLAFQKLQRLAQGTAIVRRELAGA